jgi:predicted glycosyltransferase
VDEDDIQALLPDPSERLVLCTVGGGQDGANLAEAFAQADYPPRTTGVILTGPFMPPEVRKRLRRRAAANRRLRVLDFVPNPDWLLSRADRIVAMGGYNTIYEVLSFEKHALIVPRSKPRHEQQIRAERLHALGLLDILAPDQVSPAALTAWLARDLGPAPRVRDRLDMGGTLRLPQLLQEVLVPPPETSEVSKTSEVLYGPHERRLVHAQP